MVAGWTFFFRLMLISMHALVVNSLNPPGFRNAVVVLDRHQFVGPLGLHDGDAVMASKDLRLAERSDTPWVGLQGHWVLNTVFCDVVG